MCALITKCNKSLRSFLDSGSRRSWLLVLGTSVKCRHCAITSHRNYFEEYVEPVL